MSNTTAPTFRDRRLHPRGPSESAIRAHLRDSIIACASILGNRLLFTEMAAPAEPEQTDHSDNTLDEFELTTGHLECRLQTPEGFHYSIIFHGTFIVATTGRCPQVLARYATQLAEQLAAIYSTLQEPKA